jgi:adenylate cyclase
LLQLWAVGLIAAVLVSAASALGRLERWQAGALDLLQLLQESVQGRRLPSDVVIVAIDDVAFEGLERRQPIPRQYLARVVRGLAKSGAAVVGIDVTFATPTTPADDAALAKAILDFSDNALSRVVVLGPLSAGPNPLSAAALGASVIVASPTMLADPDGVIRHVDPVSRDAGGQPAATLALAATARMAGLDARALQDALVSGRPLPLPRLGAGGSLAPSGAPPVVARAGVEWPINYVGPAGSFTQISSDSVAAIGDPDGDVAADNPLRGRLVLVGGTFADSRDFHLTPHRRMAGVEVHANVVHMLTTRRFIQPSNWLVGLAINAGVVLVAGVILVALRPLTGTLVCVGGAFLLGVPAAYVAFDRGGYWIDFVLPVAAASLMGLGSDALDRRRFRDSFARYLSRDVMARVLADAPSLRGEYREVSILFSDLRGFTTLSEQMAPERIAAHLNEYFGAMTAVIFAHRGMINDFVGDAVMAVFGAPMDDAEHAWHAVQSAVEMNQALNALNERWGAIGLPRLRMGIGIHTGSVFAGNVGGSERIKYTVIGDPVNVASRVEGLNKELNTTILITEETLGAVVDRVPVRDCGPIAVKGRVEKVRVFEVLTDGRTES